MNRDGHLLAEMYSHIKEQSPLLNNPMGAAYQGAYQALEPYAAGAVAGAKQLGQNVAGAVTGSQQAPQSPMAAGKQAFNTEQAQNAMNNFMQVFQIPAQYKNFLMQAVNQIYASMNKQQGTTPVNFGGYQQHVKDTQGAVQAAQTLAPRV